MINPNVETAQPLIPGFDSGFIHVLGGDLSGLNNGNNLFYFWRIQHLLWHSGRGGAEEMGGVANFFFHFFLPKCWLSYRAAAFECHNTQRSSSSFMTRAKKPAAIGETSQPITSVQKVLQKIFSGAE